MESRTIVYDLDTPAGLMERIQTLLAPPKSEDEEKRSRKPERGGRRSSSSSSSNISHETCDSCREAGDLLRCDHCPAAFHLQCCNPPLSREVLPPGDWMCHRCTVRKRTREQKKEQMNGLSEQDCGALRLDPTLGFGGPGLRAAVAQVRLLEKRANSRPVTPNSNTSSADTPSEPNDVEEELLEMDDEMLGSEAEISNVPSTLKRPFDLLIAAAMQRNPTQFQLPNDLTCTTTLPGTSKRRRKDEFSGKSSKRAQHDLDGCGAAPLPVKVCQACSRSCRWAPLVQCDYCPVLFHTACLEPPLTAVPPGRWMCPSHGQHVLLSQPYVTPSNRCQLFDQFQDRISQHAVKLDFLQQIHNPPLQPPHHSRKSLKVPDAIKLQYQNPTTSLSPRGLRDGELICTGLPESLLPRHVASEHEQHQWLRNLISLQCSIMRHLWERQTSLWDTTRTERTAVKRSDCPSVVELRASGSSVCSSCTGGPCLNCSNSNGAVDQQLQTNGKQRNQDTPPPLSLNSEETETLHLKHTQDTAASCEKPPPAAPPCDSMRKKSDKVSSSSEMTGVSELKAVTRGSGVVELGSLDDGFIRLLAWQRIQQLLQAKDSTAQATQACASPAHRKHSDLLTQPVQARASLCSASGRLTAAVSMCYRSLNIGTGADMDLRLANYGQCRFVSGKHACIFFDETTKHYELINYSEHGTTVDDVFYSCDVSEKTSPSPSSTLLAKVQSVIRRSRKSSSSAESNGTSPQPQDAPSLPCQCRGSAMAGSSAGWEGTALLRHGSLIKLGCLQFVFSITEFASKPRGDERSHSSLTLNSLAPSLS